MEVALVEIHADEDLGKEMAKLQDEDEELKEVKSLISRNVTNDAEWRKHLPNWYKQNKSKFVIHDGTLYHVDKIDSYPDPVTRTVIPKSKIKEMLFRAHGCMQSGHPGHNRAMARLEKFAIWKGMLNQVKLHVNTCVECQAARAKLPPRVAPLQPQSAAAPLQFIQADIFKTGESASGMNCVCVFEDRYTKYCKLYPLKDAKANSVAKCVESFITELGCPTVWGTDGGPEFRNCLIMAMCHVFNIKKEFALAYRPQTQGQTERKNRTIKAELAKRMHQFGSSWPKYLKWIEMAYNCTPHASHGYTPFFLMHGREARLPIEQGIPKICTDGWQPTMKSYIKDLLDRMAQVRKEIIRNRTIYQMKMVQQHDKTSYNHFKRAPKFFERSHNSSDQNWACLGTARGKLKNSVSKKTSLCRFTK